MRKWKSWSYRYGCDSTLYSEMLRAIVLGIFGSTKRNDNVDKGSEGCVEES